MSTIKWDVDTLYRIIPVKLEKSIKYLDSTVNTIYSAIKSAPCDFDIRYFE